MVKKKEEIHVHTLNPEIEEVGTPEDLFQTYTGPTHLLSIMYEYNPVLGKFSEGDCLVNIRCYYSETSKDIVYCKYTEDKRDIATGFADGVVRIFGISDGICKHVLLDKEIRAFPGRISCITHKPVSTALPITTTILTSNINGVIKYWKWKHEKCLFTIREKRLTYGLCYHHSTPKFVTYGADSTLNLYDEELQTQERSFYPADRLLAATTVVNAAKFNPKSNHELISGGWDSKVRCWDDRQPYPTRAIEGVHICGEGLEFDRTGRQILTCAWQEKNAIQLWDYGSCKLIRTITPDNFPSKLYCGRFIPGTDFMVCGGTDGNMIRLIDLKLEKTECSIRNNPGPIFTFDFGSLRRKTDREKAKNSQSLGLGNLNLPTVSFVTGNRLQTIDFG